MKYHFLQRGLAAVLVMFTFNLSAVAQTHNSTLNEQAKAAVNSRDYATAKAIWELMAAQNDPIAMNNLGYLYSGGYGVPLSKEKAFSYFKSAADNPTMTKPQASYNVGKAYMRGIGVPIDENKAVYYLEKAASKEIPQAYTDLGKYYFGPGVVQDKNKAFTYFRKGAFRRDPEAAYWAGYISVAGEVEDADYEVGKIYLEQAVQGGVTDAYQLMGVLAEFDFNNGGPREPAVEWYKKAQAAGNPDAAIRLAAIAAIPEKVESLGIKLIRQGRHQEAMPQLHAECESGDGASCYEEGLYYANGVYFQQNLFSAAQYLKMACDKNIIGSCLDFAKATLLKKTYSPNDNQRALGIFQQDCDSNFTVWQSCWNAAVMTWDNKYSLENRNISERYGDYACNRAPSGNGACGITNAIQYERQSAYQQTAAQYRKPSKPSFLEGLAAAFVESAASYNAGVPSYQSNSAQAARDRHSYVMSTYNKNSHNYGKCPTVNSPGC